MHAGVLNTDNMSILGLTIDYGPYGFMDRYLSMPLLCRCAKSISVLLLHDVWRGSPSPSTSCDLPCIVLDIISAVQVRPGVCAKPVRRHRALQIRGAAGRLLLELREAGGGPEGSAVQGPRPVVAAVQFLPDLPEVTLMINPFLPALFAVMAV